MFLWARYGVLAMVAVAGTARWNPPTESTPAYYSTAPRQSPTPLLHGDQLTGPYFAHPYQVTAYQMAAKVEKVLFTQPCYCRCDLALHHKSLHSCFEGTHGAVCSTCMRQAMYTYQQTELGKTPAEIRGGIMRGEWQRVDVQNATLQP